MKIYKVRIINKDYYINGNETIISSEDMTWDNPYYLELKTRGFPVPDVPEEHQSTIDNKVKIKKFENAIESFMNSKAQSKGYDNILSACTYAVAGGRFQQEGIKFAEWRTGVWDYCYQELNKIQQGLRPEPTINEFIQELPQLNI